MTRTDEELAGAAEHAMNFDPESARPIEVRSLRDISEATEAIRVSEVRQREAVALARAHDISWNLIAGALGVSRQAARQRFGAPAVYVATARVPKLRVPTVRSIPKASRVSGKGSGRPRAKSKGTKRSG